MLAVEGDWAKVRIVGWVPKDKVAPGAPSGIRVAGSPDDGVWVTDVVIRESALLGTAEVTGWIMNATGQDFCFAVFETVLVDGAGVVLGSGELRVPHFQHGETMGFAAPTLVDYAPVQSVKIQYVGDLRWSCDQ